MKSLLFLLILYSINVHSQTLPLLEKLDSPRWAERFEALKIIENEQLVEYIQALEELIFNQETLYLQYSFLYTLDALDEPSTYDLALQYYDGIDLFDPEPPYDEFDNKLEAKARINKLLFKYNDYTKVEDIFNYLQYEVSPKRYKIVIDELQFVAENIPSYYSQAVYWILYILNNAVNEISIRMTALKILNQINYSEINNLCLNILNNLDENPDIKYVSLKILFERGFPELKSVLTERVLNDASDFIRFKSGSGLLQVFGLPSDLKFIIDYYPSEPDEDTRGLFKIIVTEFIPPKPETTDIVEMINNLISYTDESFGYQWIEEEAYNYYIERLNSLIREVEEQNYEEACRLINEDLLSRIEQDYNDYGTLTVEGYKFLHYHTVYIKEELNNQFYPCIPVNKK